MAQLGRLSVSEFREREKFPVQFVLDNVRSALNVGSVFRTADAFAFAGVQLCGITAKPPHREILKTAIGATESVNWQHWPTTLAAIEHLRSAGHRILAVEQTDQPTLLHEFPISPSEKYALVLGNEVKGVTPEVLKACDQAVEIPQFGTKHSLNVAVCAGVVGWAFLRAWL